jgi:hypothetical protein
MIEIKIRIIENLKYKKYEVIKKSVTGTRAAPAAPLRRGVLLLHRVFDEPII